MLERGAQKSFMNTHTLFYRSYMSNFLVFATQLFSLFHCLALLFLGYYFLSSSSSLWFCFDPIYSCASIFRLFHAYDLMNAFFHDFWSQRHRRVMKTTNVSHKILKFNKFSSTNFNLVSCLPFFHCDSLINRSYVHFFVLKIQFSWPHGRDYKITCGLHSLHISAREIELRECRAAKKLFEKVPTKYWSEFRLPLFGV